MASRIWVMLQKNVHMSKYVSFVFVVFTSIPFCISRRFCGIRSKTAFYLSSLYTCLGSCPNAFGWLSHISWNPCYPPVNSTIIQPQIAHGPAPIHLTLTFILLFTRTEGDLSRHITPSWMKNRKVWSSSYLWRYY